MTSLRIISLKPLIIQGDPKLAHRTNDKDEDSIIKFQA